MFYSYLIAVVLAYVIGSIPTAVWIGRRYYNTDIREHGSGNAGATNTFRVLGVKAGIIVLVIDVLKGFCAVIFSYLIAKQIGVHEEDLLRIIAGLSAVMGHIYPLFADFRGGKGVATIMGAVLGINPIASIVAIIVFLSVLIIFKYVSLGSVLGGLTFPITVFVFQPEANIYMQLFSIFVTVMLILNHFSNIKRLWNRTENKTYLFGNKKK
ncbi:MAG: glycerol-3-phosphate 1-O-acyltransferase PlsY [Salinivirgaceae bacterium]|jgi:glycerol-3-phosphate acyltransferase PlsY|nr:glycerol-3-phosphate 1-O-acyltransferase PlsY [Salinivirgaceae bacterium]MDY0281676.1 glycerol-3-phosphate 1-O-acyltransferase PlsY [Salinivirgaceae bacterium]